MSKVERYLPGDTESCLAIFSGNRKPYFAGHEFELFERFLKTEAASQPYFVVRDGDALAACGGFYRDGNAVYLNWGMVRRDAQRKGWGRILLDYRLARIRETYPGLPVRIETSQHTRGFYERRGFAVVSIQRDGFEPRLDKVVMERRPSQHA